MLDNVAEVQSGKDISQKGLWRNRFWTFRYTHQTNPQGQRPGSSCIGGSRLLRASGLGVRVEPTTSAFAGASVGNPAVLGRCSPVLDPQWPSTKPLPPTAPGQINQASGVFRACGLWPLSFEHCKHARLTKNCTGRTRPPGQTVRRLSKVSEVQPWPHCHAWHMLGTATRPDQIQTP